MKKLLILLLLAASNLCAMVAPSLTSLEIELIQAATKGQDKTIKDNLGKPGFNINFTDPITGNTLMHFAAQNGNYEIVKLLMKNDANVNIKNKDGNTPLHLAILNRFPTIVKYIIEDYPAWTFLSKKFTADLLLQNNDGNTPLHLAVLVADSKIINDIYGSRKDDFIKSADIYNNFGNKPIHMLAQSKSDNASIVKTYKEWPLELQKLEKNKDGNTLLQLAILAKNLPLVKIILEKSDVLLLSVDNNGNTPLHLAVQNKLDDIALEIIKQIFDSKKTEILKIKNKAKETVLENIAENGDVDLLKAIINGWYNLGKTKDEILTLLNEQNQDQDTLLHIAARNGKHEIVGDLILNQVDVNKENYLQRTPLSVALANKELKLVPAVKDRYQKVIDHIIQRLKQLGLLNEKDSRGNTPLHLAVIYKDIEIVQKLLGLNVDTSIQNNDNSTAAKIAENAGYHDIAKLINAHHAGKSTMSISDLQQLEATLRGLSKAAK